MLLSGLENTFGSVCVRSLGNSTIALRRKYLPLKPRKVKVLVTFSAIAPLECPVGLNHLVFGKAGQELECVDVLSVYVAEDTFLRD